MVRWPDTAPRVRLGRGIESEIAPLLVQCECGGRFEPGVGEGEIAVASLTPPASADCEPGGRGAAPSRGWPSRPGVGGRALRATGQEEELSGEEVLELRLEQRLNDLLIQMERAHRAGDEDAAEAAHARYVELATT